MSFFHSGSHFLSSHHLCVPLEFSPSCLTYLFNLESQLQNCTFQQKNSVSQTFASIISANLQSLSCTCLILHFKPGLQCVLVEIQAIKKKSACYLAWFRSETNMPVGTTQTNSNFCFRNTTSLLRWGGKNPIRRIQHAMDLNCSTGLPVCFLLLSEMPWYLFHHQELW